MVDLKPGRLRGLHIKKEWISHPLDDWKSDGVLHWPKWGSKASLRNGRLHVHDMGDRYDLHMDLVDFKEHPMKHVVMDCYKHLFRLFVILISLFAVGWTMILKL